MHEWLAFSLVSLSMWLAFYIAEPASLLRQKRNGSVLFLKAPHMLMS
jgi:hypothetical protein